MKKRKRLTTEDIKAMTENLRHQPLKLSPTPVCDFCGAPPAWCYAATRTSQGEKKMCWRWCACEDCAGLITNCLWSTLKSRMALKLASMTRLGYRYTAPAVEVVFKEFLLYAEESV